MKTTRSQISNVGHSSRWSPSAPPVPQASSLPRYQGVSQAAGLPGVRRVVPVRRIRPRPHRPFTFHVSGFRFLSALWLISTVLGLSVRASEPPTPVQLGKTPPPFPAPVVGTNDAGGLILSSAFPTNPPPPVVYVTNTVYIIPSNTVIRIQVRDRLDSGDWFEPVVFKSRTEYKFFRVLFETEAEQ